MLALLGCGQNSSERPLILSDDEYNEYSRKAHDLSFDILKHKDVGSTVTSDERTKLLRSALIFDGMADYQPTNITSYLGAAKCHLLLGQDDAAISRLMAGLKHMPENPNAVQKDSSVEARYLLSVAYFDKHDYPAALKWINEAISMFGSSPIYYSQRAAIFGELRQLDAEQADLELALKLDPHHEKSLALMKLVMQAQSDRYLESATKKLNAKDYAGAIADADKGLDAALYAPLYAVRAAANIELKHFAEAKKDVAALEALDPQSADLQTLKKRLK